MTGVARPRYQMAYLRGAGPVPPYRRQQQKRQPLPDDARVAVCSRCAFASSAAGLRSHRAHGCLPAEPLLALVRARGGPGVCGAFHSEAVERAYCRAVATGRLTDRAADRLAVDLLGMTAWEVWGDLVA